MFARYLAGSAIEPLVAAADSLAHHGAMAAIEQKNELQRCQAELKRAAKRREQDESAFGAERKAFQQQFEKAVADSESERGKLQDIVDGKTAEVERMWQQNERSAKNVAELNRKLEEQRTAASMQADKHRTELSKCRDSSNTKVSELNQQMIMAERTRSAEKQDSLSSQLRLEAKVAELERQVQSVRSQAEDTLSRRERQFHEDLRRERERVEEATRKAAADQSNSLAVKKLDADLKDLRAHNKLMKEHLDVTKDLLKAKTSHVVEVEYQWAAAKAKLAQSQLDREELDADVCVLEDLVTKLKLKAIKTSQDLRSLRLTQKQTQRFYSL